jgi:hypothetical protein
MVAGPSPHPSAYAAGDRLACRRAATHRWLSPWGWRRWRRRRWRRWWRPASCWPSRSTGRRPTGSTHPCPTWAAPASSRSSRRGMVGRGLPAVPGPPRPSRRPAAAPPAAAPRRRVVPRRGVVPRHRAVVAARWWPCRAARRGRNRSRSPRPPPLRPRRPLPSRHGPNRTGPAGTGDTGPTTSRMRTAGPGRPRLPVRTGPGRRAATTSRVAGRPAPTGTAGTRTTTGGGRAATGPTGTGTGTSGSGMTTGTAGTGTSTGPARTSGDAGAYVDGPPGGGGGPSIGSTHCARHAGGSNGWA